MRASRLLSIILLLQTRGRLTAHELAETLEVSPRTVYRDIESLHAAGIPLYGDAGPGGGYRLMEGFRTRLTGMTTDEAGALFLTGLPGPAADLGLGTVMAAARLKLQAALPPDLRDRAARIQERFHLDAPGWYHDGDQAPYLAAVADAVWNQRRIRIGYRRWKEPTDVTRTLEPYGIVLKAGRWYLVARADGRTRTYRANQILELAELDEPFERDPEFDLPAYWAAYLRDFRSRLFRDEATVRLSPAGRQRVREVMSDAVIQAVDGTASAPDANGWVTAVIPIEALNAAHTDLLKLGADAEVLSPKDLRDRMVATAQGFSRLYLTTSV